MSGGADADLTALFPGALAGFAGCCAWATEDSAVSVQPRLDDLLRRFQRAQRGAWQPSCSLWAQAYFNTLLIPGVCVLGCRASDCRDIVGVSGSFCPETGVPLRFAFQRRSHHEATEVSESGLLTVLDRTTIDLIDELHTRTRLSKRMLRESAGLTVNWTLEQLAATDPERAQRSADALIRLRFMKEGGVCRLGEPRRICCLRYQLPSFDACPLICPRAS